MLKVLRENYTGKHFGGPLSLEEYELGQQFKENASKVIESDDFRLIKFYQGKMQARQIQVKLVLQQIQKLSENYNTVRFKVYEINLNRRDMESRKPRASAMHKSSENPSASNQTCGPQAQNHKPGPNSQSSSKITLMKFFRKKKIEV